MCPSFIEIGSKTAEKNSAQTNRQTTDRQTDTTKIMVTWPWTNTAVNKAVEESRLRPRQTAANAKYAPLSENMTSSTKPEVRNLLYCRQRRTKPLPQTGCLENFSKFGRVVFEICERTDRQTCRSQYFAPLSIEPSFQITCIHAPRYSVHYPAALRVIMAALCNRGAIIFLSCSFFPSFLLSSFFLA